MLKRTVLIVDDEKPIVDILKFNLQKEGYDVLEAYDGEEGLHLALTQNPDIVLLDVMLPLKDGFTVCREIRQSSSVPILMLTAREEEVDRVLGLELGADDYITKPFFVREISARVKANLRRLPQNDVAERKNAEPENSNILMCSDLVINFDRYEVKKSGVILDVTLREFELLKFLATQTDKIFSRETLLEKVWGFEFFGDVRTVDVTVRRLREKIENDPSDPKYIMTKRGVGYYFNK